MSDAPVWIDYTNTSIKLLGNGYALVVMRRWRALTPEGWGVRVLGHMLAGAWPSQDAAKDAADAHARVVVAGLVQAVVPVVQ